jgi:TolB protein
MDSDPVDPVHFTFKVTLGIDAAWSPDGSRIAFMSDRAGNNDIYVVHADSSNLAKLTDTGSDEQPAWALVR